MNSIPDIDGSRPTALKLSSNVSTPIGSLKNYITQPVMVATAINKDKVVANNFPYKRRFN